MQGMVHALSALELVILAPLVVKDFWDYGALFTNLYQDLSGQVKNNHIFTCNGNDSFVLVIELWERNLEGHKERKHEATKKNRKAILTWSIFMEEQLSSFTILNW